jgi:hypothetical protein
VDEARPAHVFRWDLDKTYLRTEFDSLRGLLRAAFEKAGAKKTVPGAPALLRELRRGRRAHVAIISGSPRQMRRVLQEKLRLDGVEFDELTLKPNLTNILRGRFRAMREQVGYKLPALLEGRLRVTAPHETLFGDDAEADAFIYSLYADLLAGRADRDLLVTVLERSVYYSDLRERALDLYARAPEGDPVRRIFIHLDGRTPTSRFERYGGRLVAIYNYFQAALVLYEDGVLDGEAVMRIADEMAARYGYTLAVLGNSMQDLVLRGRLSLEAAQRVARLAPVGEALPAPVEVRRTLEARLRVVEVAAQAVAPPPAVPVIDYLGALEDAAPRSARPVERPPPSTV